MSRVLSVSRGRVVCSGGRGRAVVKKVTHGLEQWKVWPGSGEGEPNIRAVSRGRTLSRGRAGSFPTILKH